jgi:hypothetical protein
MAVFGSAAEGETGHAQDLLRLLDQTCLAPRRTLLRGRVAAPGDPG